MNKHDLHSAGIRDIFSVIYGNSEETLHSQVSRYLTLINQFVNQFGEADFHLFSTPGRTEIGGNHTDHNHGRVLAGSVNLDSIAVAAGNDLNKIVMYSEGYPQPFSVDLNYLEIFEDEKGTTSALIRGVAARFKALGLKIGGFNAAVSSNVLPGSGLSSSASIEVLIGTIFNALFNQGKASAENLALIGQYAENVYFGKPCGLMDQVACAVGGIVAIDFKNPQRPEIDKIEFDFEEQPYSLVIVDTGGNHAVLTEEYAAIPGEMKAVAASLGKEVCRDINQADVLDRIQSLRVAAGDRAVLRALHFIKENERVVKQVKALKNREFMRFLNLVKESGNSSFKWLQNVYAPQSPAVQGLSLALSITEQFLSENDAGACRVHGGGFAGTIQAFVSNNYLDEYIRLMDRVFVSGAARPLNIRPYGTLYLNTFLS